jgi:hypothetical protein
MVLPPGHQPTKVLEASEKSLNSPTFAVTAQWTTVLRRASANSAMRCNHHDTVAINQVTVQTVAVIGSVANQSFWETVKEAVSEDAFDELAFVRRCAFDTNGERKTVIIGESDDFRPLAAFRGADRETSVLHQNFVQS